MPRANVCRHDAIEVVPPDEEATTGDVRATFYERQPWTFEPPPLGPVVRGRRGIGA